VHIQEGWGVENAHQGLETVVYLSRGVEITALHMGEELGLEIGRNAAHA
jgi:hypothetical protein